MPSLRWASSYRNSVSAPQSLVQDSWLAYQRKFVWLEISRASESGRHIRRLVTPLILRQQSKPRRDGLRGSGQGRVLLVGGVLSCQVVAVGVHHLVPRGHEVLHEALLGVGAGIDLGDCPQLTMRTEDQVHAGARPLDL